MKLYMPSFDSATGGSDAIHIDGSYQITESDQPTVWSNRRFEVHAVEKGSDRYILSGFTNQGVNITGVLSGRHLKFNRQQVRVLPEGGDGKVEWSIDMEGEAVFQNTTVKLSYCIYDTATAMITGHINANKIP